MRRDARTDDDADRYNLKCIWLQQYAYAAARRILSQPCCKGQIRTYRPPYSCSMQLVVSCSMQLWLAALAGCWLYVRRRVLVLSGDMMMLLLLSLNVIKNKKEE
jgi:hypothetical protein